MQNGSETKGKKKIYYLDIRLRRRYIRHVLPLTSFMGRGGRASVAADSKPPTFFEGIKKRPWVSCHGRCYLLVGFVYEYLKPP